MTEQRAEERMDATEWAGRKNLGVLRMPHMPTDLWVVGGIAVMFDGEKYSLVFDSTSQNHELPIPEVREELGALIIQAWDTANNPGFIEEGEN